MSVETLRKEAARKRMLVEALEEEGRAEDLRASAERAAKRATELRSQAGSGSGEEVLGAFATLAALGAVGYWLFG
jgi:hypothetical protein